MPQIDVSVRSSSTVLRSPFAATLIIGGFFFVFGFVTWLNGPLIAFVKLAFTLDDVSAFLVPMAFYMSYFFLSLPGVLLLRRTGMKRGMALALAILAIGAAGFGQCTLDRWFPGALASLFIMGAGLSILQTAVNPYISILGPIDSAAQRIAIMGICNKTAGIIAPLIVGRFVLSDLGSIAAQLRLAAIPLRDHLIHDLVEKIYGPYLAMAGVLGILAVCVLWLPLPEVTDEANPEVGNERKSILLFPNLWLGFLAIFFYLGVEVIAGDAIGTYGAAFGLPLDQTKYFTSFTLVAMLAGYVVGGICVPRWISQARYLVISAILGLVLTVAAGATKGIVSVGFVAALGFANAMMWPAIFPLGIRGLGRHTETGAAILVMGIAGGAVLPQMFAWFKTQYNFQWVFVGLVALSYLYILLFGTLSLRSRPRAIASE